MELHVEAQHTEVDPTLRDWIGARCEALNTPHADIVHARVALVKHPRHLRGSDEARVVFTLSGKIINVTRAGETLEDALYKVFDVLERELHDFRSLRRGVSKDPRPARTRAHCPPVRRPWLRLHCDRYAPRGLFSRQCGTWDALCKAPGRYGGGSGHRSWAPGPPGHPGHTALAVAIHVGM